MSSFPDLLTSFDDAVQALKVKLSQDSSKSITYNGEVIQSIAKDLDDKWAAIQALVDSALAFETKVLMDAYTPTASEEGFFPLAKTWNDTDINNGMYGWNGVAWVKSSYDPVQRMIDAGYRRNEGSHAPMQARERDGVTSGPHAEMLNTLIDVKVIGAKEGKLYRIEWMGNGADNWRPEDRYNVLIYEYEEANYGTDSANGRRALQGLNQGDFSTINPINGVVTRYFRCQGDESIAVLVSHMPEKISGESVSWNSEGYAGYSWIIDPINYVYSPVNDYLQEDISGKFDEVNGKLDEIDGKLGNGVSSLNAGVNFPMTPMVRDGITSESDPIMLNAFLDIKVYNSEPNKYYRVEWLGHNSEAVSSVDKFQIIVAEYDSEYFGSDSNANRFELHGLGDTQGDEVPSGQIITRTITCAKKPSVKVKLTYDTSALSDTNIWNSESTSGYSWVIDPSNYIEAVPSIESSNKGLYAPLEVAARDGETTQGTILAKNTLLDCKIYGAKPGKLYKLEWLGGGVEILGKNRYDVLIDEYDATTYATDSQSGRRSIFQLQDFEVGDGYLEQPQGDTFTQVLTSKRDPSITVSVTYDSTLIEGSQLAMNSTSSQDYTSIISPKNYLYTTPGDSDDKSPNGHLSVRHTQGGVVEVVCNHGSERCKVMIDQRGPNSLMAIWSYYISPIKDGGFDQGFVLKTGGSSDWIGSWSMQAAQNGNGNGIGWSGGSHDATSSGSTGDPSAQTDSYEVYTEFGDLHIAENSEDIVNCNTVSVTVHNSLYAHNTVPKTGFTERFVLKEIVTYTFKALPDGSGVTVNVTLEAEPLEKIEIGTYYGLQIHAGGLDSFWFPGCEQAERWPKDMATNSGVKSTYNKIDRFTAISNDSKYCVIGWVDPNFGIARIIDRIYLKQILWVLLLV
ncbi:hypothetical protein R7070_04740 [Vibrio sp. 1557]|uniref:hypothetical protein n=1 Tax=Vibrio sp. 1557 TaxID=3074561 RepID=UPI0029650A7D|nr:hypothetical protein [Vibrio sp. 1557]MDW2262054.1 hypothetical protein [Vibrio sp. 1557]